MNTIQYLEKQYQTAFDMLKHGETKNTALIAFNGAIIIGMIKLVSDIDFCPVFVYLHFIILMSSISIFISLSAMVAKIKHTSNSMALHPNDNLLFYAKVAQLAPDELIEAVNTKYKCESTNLNYERDLARQTIITSQIACRKYKLFNVAIGFTFAGILTPISILIYELFMNQDK